MGASELEEAIKETEENIVKLTHTLQVLSAELSKKRKKGIPIFVKKTEDLLKKLGLEKAKIDVELSETADFNLFGKEDIQLLFQDLNYLHYI